MPEDEFEGTEEEFHEHMPDQGRQLYIKVPGYKHILEDLEGINQVLDNMRESLQVLHTVEEVKQKSIDVFVENVERLNEQLDDINREMPEVHDIEVHTGGGRVDMGGEEVIDESVKELRDELSGLQQELDQIE